ncbi:quinone oxidoreductase [Agrobacterium tumefaciens]|uniref:quinone oxidoreductase family protein n=1 Tax=Agrobacterium tumefaciens TaxID=358 RepID=UPI001571D90F|nr:quinone oxidoreductase [Agrobacterium tumefaciens]NTB95500.1 quinone oxidoreductase [Agrobacterium tumefaciens]NTC47648.1 quinone oxidoreductase [Agrobacterium tumefaciens]
MAVSAQSFKIYKTGSVVALELVKEPLGAPPAGQVQVRHEAIGVNYIDVYHRTGAYPLQLPSGIGVEGAGTVEAIGEGVEGLRVGDRVAYVGGAPGAYATVRHIAAARVVKLPDTISAKTAASLIFKGVTVEYLIRRCHEVKAGDVVLWHAAAGGVGSIACQWLRHIGATVIGTVGSEDKIKAARENGCSHTIVLTKEDLAKRVKEITDGDGVSAAYDGIGGDTFYKSLDCLRPRGILVSFGTVAGPVAPLDLGALGSRGSLYVTRASLAHYTAKREELEASAKALFTMIDGGYVTSAEPTIYALRDAQAAHRDLEAGKTRGSVVLIP